MTDWDPDFALRHPAFAICAGFPLSREHWPTRAELNALLEGNDARTASGHPVVAVPAPAAKPSAWRASYEGRLYETGELAVRDADWHDLLNVLVWCRFPRLKAAINARHHAEISGRGTLAGPRGRVRDALTLFDESGCVIACADASLAEDLRERRWCRLFHERRQEVGQAMAFFVIGHALLDKLLHPYLEMTARCLILPLNGKGFGPDAAARSADAMAAAVISADPLTPAMLPPLPVVGIPEWWPGNERADFYLNEAVFRPARRTRPGSA